MNLSPKYTPFKHWIADGEFSASLVEAANVEWPSNNWPHWHLYKGFDSYKYATKDVERLSPACKLLFDQLCCIDISSLTGDEVFPDLTGYGAGLHWIPENGHLHKHLDSNVHPVTNWVRKYSMCLYLNEVEGGFLHLETKHGSQTTKIETKKNRLVVFECGESSYHRVTPVKSKEGRRSIASFFWSIEDPPETTRTSAEFT
tara:strand:+ start:37850 stop:38452 length:603 start_codon:yes stop_codon:yes gene_type:complete